ncbi:MAG: alkyl hydroperoxide reductase [Bdellovibrionota bacterium]
MKIFRQPTQSYWLLAAGIYNVVWGTFIVLFPNAIFKMVNMEIPNYPEIWQCVGMIVGVYGVGYWIASKNPLRHWPIVLVGLMGKILGPIGFLGAWLQGRFALGFFVVIIFNDLVWWIPFSRILLRARRDDELRA